MRSLIRAVALDVVLVLAGVLIAFVASLLVAATNGTLKPIPISGTFEYADGRVVRAETPEKIRELLADPDRRYEGVVLDLRRGPGLPHSMRVAAIAFFPALLGVALFRGRHDLPRWRSGLRSWGIGLLAGLGMAGLGQAYDALVGLLGIPTPDWRMVLSWFGPWGVIVTVAILAAPVAEETYFRGRLFSLLDRAKGERFAMIATALVFAAVHGVAVYFPIYLLFGIVLAYLRVRSGNLVAPIAAHAVNNLIAVSLVYAAP
jgi:Predicted metal-dependent membrane protease